MKIQFITSLNQNFCLEKKADKVTYRYTSMQLTERCQTCASASNKLQHKLNAIFVLYVNSIPKNYQLLCYTLILYNTQTRNWSEFVILSKGSVHKYKFVICLICCPIGILGTPERMLIMLSASYYVGVANMKNQQIKVPRIVFYSENSLIRSETNFSM